MPRHMLSKFRTNVGRRRCGTLAAGVAMVLATLALTPPIQAAEPYKPPSRDAEPPIGFGAIPFGTEAEAVMALNNGNGNLNYPPQGAPVFTYPVVLAGLRFQVTQYFDENNRAIDAEAAYTSGEDERSCVARFNYILAGLNARYGIPTVVPDVVREIRGGNVVSLYAAQYDFRDRTSIRGTVETTRPEGGAAAGGAAGGGGAGGGGGTNCRIALHYYPPGWIASY